MTMLDLHSTSKEYLNDLPSSSKWLNDNFVMGDLLGAGTFGKVYTAQCRRKPEQLYAVKELTRCTQPRYVATEIKVMRELGGMANIMNVQAAYRERDRVFIVMDHFPHDSFKEYISQMSYREIIDYMKNLFISLEYLHENNIIHRDIKPANFLYNRQLRKYSLIDFGLSQKYIPISSPTNSPVSKENVASVLSPRKRNARRLAISGNTTDLDESMEKKRRMNCNCTSKAMVCSICRNKPKKTVNKAGTPGFRAPEILLKFNDQTPVLDIWSSGVTLLSLLFKRHPIFRPSDDFEAIVQIAQLIGMVPLVEVANKEGVSLLSEPSYPGVDLVKMIHCVRDGLDVLVDVPDHCRPCADLFYSNTKGKCLCKTSEPMSLTTLSCDQRLCVDILTRCLQPDPRRRQTASLLLQHIIEYGC